MVRPAHEERLAELPMAGGSLSVHFEDVADLSRQRRDFLGNSGLFVHTKEQPRPFCEFLLTMVLPNGETLDPLPARLVQIVPYGEPGLMLQLMKYPDNQLRIIDDWLANAEVNSGDAGTSEAAFAPDDMGSELDDMVMDEGSDAGDDPNEEIDSEPPLLEEEKPEKKRNDSAVFSVGSSRVAMLEQLRKMTPNERQRLATIANRPVRSMLMRDVEASVTYFLLKNPHISQQEVIEISKINSINHHVVTAILANKQWSSSEELRNNLVRNPKTPVTIAIKLLSGLNIKHLRELAKDWGIKTQIKQAALRLVLQRGEG